MIMSDEDRQASVYKLYDAMGILVYVGVSTHGMRTIQQDTQTRPWWPEVASVQVENFPTRKLAQDRERYLIINDQPRYN
jgi:hypothetical protein